MLTIKYLYENYNESLTYKIQFCINKIKEYQKTSDYLKECILNNEDHFTKYNISVTGLISYPNTAYNKIAQLVENGHLSKVGHYVKSFSTNNHYLSEYLFKYNKLLNSRISYKTYKIILFNIHRETSRYILEGNTWQLSIVGSIYIAGKSNEKALLHKCIPRVNWLKTEQCKQRILAEGKTLYDKNTNPTGTKYHIYHDNAIDYWWCWNGGYINNKSFYRFIPNNFCHSRNRSQVLFTNTCTTKDQIYDSLSLGNRDKLQALLRFDSLHFMNYRKLN